MVAHLFRHRGFQTLDTKVALYCVFISHTCRSIWFMREAALYEGIFEFFLNRIALLMLFTGLSAYLCNWAIFFYQSGKNDLFEENEDENVIIYQAKNKASVTEFGEDDDTIGISEDDYILHDYNKSVSSEERFRKFTRLIAYGLSFLLLVSNLVLGLEYQYDSCGVICYESGIILITIMSSLLSFTFLGYGLAIRFFLQRFMARIGQNLADQYAEQLFKRASRRVMIVGSLCFISFFVQMLFFLKGSTRGKDKASDYDISLYTYPYLYYTIVNLIPAVVLFIVTTPDQDVARIDEDEDYISVIEDCRSSRSRNFSSINNSYPEGKGSSEYTAGSSRIARSSGNSSGGLLRNSITESKGMIKVGM